MGFIAAILVGCYAYTQLDIEAYPDPSPPLMEIITQNPAWSAEEMEQQVTIPVENAIYGSPHLEQGRSTSILGLTARGGSADVSLEPTTGATAELDGTFCVWKDDGLDGTSILTGHAHPEPKAEQKQPGMARFLNSRGVPPPNVWRRIRLILNAPT
ncbi:MAG: efflux RND transporter permease subunit [Acidobacteriaceae bacterium]